MARDQAEIRTPEQRRFQFLIVARFLVAIACVTVLIALEGGSIFSSQRFKYAYFVLLVVSAIDLMYVPLLRRVLSPVSRGLLQGIVDLAFVTALVYLSDGVYSPFVLLYFGAVLAGALYFSTVGALVFGGAAAGLLIGVGALFHYAALNDLTLSLVSPDTLRDHLDFRRTIGETLLPAVGFLGVAFLSSRLATASRRERVLMEEILHGVGDGVVTVDRQGKTVFCNRAARSLLDLPDGFSPFGQPFTALLKAAALRRSLDLGNLDFAGSFTAEVAPENGPGRVLNVTASPVADPSGRARGAMYLLRDLTLEKRAEAAVKKAARLQDISEMAAGIAHEIRNPLASIRGSIQELHTSELMRDDDKKLMKIILKECDRLNRITEDFLRFAERQSLDMRDCDLAALLKEVEGHLNRSPEKGASAIHAQVDGDPVIQADTEGIRQVLLNVGRNALEAMEGGGSLRIRISPVRGIPRRSSEGEGAGGEVDGISISISDTGSGIPNEVADRIFNPFYSTKPKGFGLGLSLAYRIIDAHRGTIKVDTREGTGTTFRIWLPRDLAKIS